MAIVTIGLPVTGIRGRLGGVVFSANRSGPFARGLTNGVNPGSIGQMEHRGFMAEMGSRWRTLTTVQQAAWDTLAATPPETDYNSLGEVYQLSGFGWFCRVNLRRKRTGQAWQDTAGTPSACAAPLSFGLTLYPAEGDANEAVLSYTNDDFLSHYAILKLSLAPGVGTNVQTSRYLICYEDNPGTGSSVNFGAAYYAAFGVTQVGMRFFAQLYRQSSDSIRSTPLELFADVEAGP